MQKNDRNYKDAGQHCFGRYSKMTEYYHMMLCPFCSKMLECIDKEIENEQSRTVSSRRNKPGA